MLFLFRFLLFLACFTPLTLRAQMLTGFSPLPEKQVVAPVLSSTSAAPVQMASAATPEPLDEVQPSVYVYHPFVTDLEASVATSAAEAPPEKGSEAPVDLQADQMNHDEQARTISASGNVMMAQGGRILRADEMDYDLGSDTVHAKGDVVLNEENGDIHLSDEVTYQNKLKNGTVKNLHTTTKDGSRFTAETGTREAGVKTTMEEAMYTPCLPCKANPEKPPLWDLRASEVTHNTEEHRVSYKNARFEVMGVPVAYTPYFSHSDGTVKQKSGFLAPSAGYKSALGTFAEGRYYWAIAPDQDATMGLMAMTDQDPLATAEYRKRWDHGFLTTSGGVTSSSRTDSTAGQAVHQGAEMRGHVFADGLWDLNDTWRTGLNLKWTSDDQYMRQYDFTNEDVLKNKLYAERFSGRDYATVSMAAYHDTRIRAEPLDQPNVLPEVYASFKGEPGAVPLVKGQWSVETSALGLQRGGNEQDLQRVGVGLSWKRRLVSDYGLLTTAEAKLREDVYRTTDRTTATLGSGQSSNVIATRAFPQAHVQTSYPMVRDFEAVQAKIEPVVALTVAPNISNNDRIPNEDSTDVQIDTSNLFEPNRFAGYDRVEDQSRVTYGMRTGLFGYEGSSGEVFVGQSYRLYNDDNPFPQGSGLDQQGSDVVGQITARYKNIYNLDYKIQLANQTFASQRHEIDAGADWNRFRLSGQYLFAKGLEGTDITESREQVQANAQFYVSKDWRLRTGATQDLGQSPGLRKAYGGIDYLGQCLALSLTGEKNFTSDVSGDSSTEILFRVGLKNLGEFEESGFRSPSETP